MGKNSPDGESTLRINGLDDAAPEVKVTGTAIWFRGGKQHGLAHGQFFDQQAVQHPVHQASLWQPAAASAFFIRLSPCRRSFA